MTTLEIFLLVLACLGAVGTTAYAYAFHTAGPSREEQKLIYEGGLRRMEKERAEAKKKREDEDRRIRGLAFEAIHEVAKGLPQGKVESTTLRHKAYLKAQEDPFATIIPMDYYR